MEVIKTEDLKSLLEDVQQNPQDYFIDDMPEAMKIGVVITLNALLATAKGDEWKIDAEPVVRCKDCKHYYLKEWVVGGGSYTTCWYQTIANAQPDDFCSRAERKEE